MPLQALVNVPALSERTLRRDIEKGDFSTGTEIQVNNLYASISIFYSTLYIQWPISIISLCIRNISFLS